MFDFLYNSVLAFFSSIFIFFGGVDTSLYEEVEENSQEVYEQFDRKNEETLMALKGSGFETLRKGLSDDIQQNREESKRMNVSFTTKWAYNFSHDDENPKGLFRRVLKDKYKKHFAKNNLDELQWETVIDLDAFIKENTFPKEITEPSGGKWSCLRDPQTKEYLKCLVGFSQSGGDRNVAYEFDFETLSWVKEKSFNYEYLGRSSFEWIDANTVLINFDELAYHNITDPENRLSLKEGASEKMISKEGYPIQVKLWKRGQTVEDSPVIYKAQAGTASVGSSKIELKDQAKDKVLLFYEYHSPQESHIQIGVKKDEGPEYKVSSLELPKDFTHLNYLSRSKDQIDLYFRTKTKWKNFNNKDLISSHFKVLEDRSLKRAPNTSIFKLSSEQGHLSSVSLVEGERFNPKDDKIIIGLTKDVSDRAMILTPKKKNRWKATDLSPPIDMPYRSMRIWEDGVDKSLLMQITGFLTPTHKYLVTQKGDTFDYELLFAGRKRFDSSKYKVDQIWVDRGLDQNGKSIQVPYYIVYNPKKAKLRGGTHKPLPTLIYAYGGFAIDLKPGYLGRFGEYWLDKGGVYVVANIRGGSEFGSYWHSSALKENRRNTYGDFIAISEDLIERGITSSEKLAIMGGSNGGLLTGVAVTKRPDLYKAAVINVPLLDMMRYHKLYVGSSWMSEYGDPEGDQKAFWKEYSPLHSLKKDVNYPKVFLKTNRFDDRVHPAHARKFALRLDKFNQDYFYYEDPQGGHGGDTMTSYEQALAPALLMKYLYDTLGMKAS